MTGRHSATGPLLVDVPGRRPPVRLLACSAAGALCLAFAGGWVWGPDGPATVTAAPAVHTTATVAASRCGERLPIDPIAVAIGQLGRLEAGGRG